MNKTCNICKQTKPSLEFNRNKNSKDGLCYFCRECGKKHWHAHKKAPIISELGKILTKDFLLENYIKQDKTQTAIAKTIGCDHSVVGDRLRKYQIPIKSLKGIKKSNLPSKETREKMGKAHKGFKFSEESKKQMSKSAKGRKCSKTQKERMSKSHIGKPGTFTGYKHTEEAKLKIGLAHKGKSTFRKYEDLKEPTCYETKLLGLIEKHSLPFKYVGNSKFWLTVQGRYFNPDFISSKGDKVAVEVYHDYFKVHDYGSVENYVKERTEMYNALNWKSIFIGDEIINSKNWEEKSLGVLQKQ